MRTTLRVRSAMGPLQALLRPLLRRAQMMRLARCSVSSSNTDPSLLADCSVRSAMAADQQRPHTQLPRLQPPTDAQNNDEARLIQAAKWEHQQTTRAARRCLQVGGLTAAAYAACAPGQQPLHVAASMLVPSLSAKQNCFMGCLNGQQFGFYFIRQPPA